MFDIEDLNLIKNGQPIIQETLNQHVIQLNSKLGKFQGLNELNGQDIKNDSIPYGKLQGNSVQESNLINSSVTKDKIQANSVTEVKLQDSQVTKDKIQNTQVTENKLQDNSVTEGKLQDNQVTNNKIKDNSIQPIKLQKIEGGMFLGQIGEGLQDVQALSGTDLLSQLDLGSQAQYNVGEEIGEVLTAGQFNIGVFEPEDINVLVFLTEEELDKQPWEETYWDEDLDDFVPNPNYDSSQEEPESLYEYGDIKDLPQGFYQLGKEHPQNPLKSQGKEVTLIVTMHRDSLQTFIQQSIESINGKPKLFIQNTLSSINEINWTEVGGSSEVTLVQETITLGANTSKNYNIINMTNPALFDMGSVSVDVLIKDTEVGSPTENMYINSEAFIITQLSQNREQVRLHNQRDSQVSQMVRITISSKV